VERTVGRSSGRNSKIDVSTLRPALSRVADRGEIDHFIDLSCRGRLPSKIPQNGQDRRWIYLGFYAKRGRRGSVTPKRPDQRLCRASTVVNGARDPYLSGMKNRELSVCKLCANKARLIDAHVIPRSFWETDAAQPPPRMVTNIEGLFPKRIPIGVYDETIVCEPCERSFGDYDSYAAQLFLRRFNEFEEVGEGNGRSTGYVLGNVDYRLLKLFAIAVLWRESVSSHSFFSRVRLGPFEEKAREMLVRGDPGDAATFATLFSVWDEAVPVLMDPFAERWGGVRSYRFYLGRFVAYIKADSRPFPEPLAKAVLTPEGPLHVISRQLAASKDFRVMEHVLTYEVIRQYRG